MTHRTALNKYFSSSSKGVLWFSLTTASAMPFQKSQLIANKYHMSYCRGKTQGSPLDELSFQLCERHQVGDALQQV